MILSADIRPGTTRLVLFDLGLVPLRIASFAIGDERSLYAAVCQFLGACPYSVESACFAVDVPFDVYAHELAEVFEIPAVTVVARAEAAGFSDGRSANFTVVLVGAAGIAAEQLSPSSERLVHAA